MTRGTLRCGFIRGEGSRIFTPVNPPFLSEWRLGWGTSRGINAQTLPVLCGYSKADPGSQDAAFLKERHGSLQGTEAGSYWFMRVKLLGIL